MNNDKEPEKDWKEKIKADKERVSVSIKKSAFEFVVEYYGDIDAYIEDHLLDCYSLVGAHAIQRHHPDWKIKRKAS